MNSVKLSLLFFFFPLTGSLFLQPPLSITQPDIANQIDTWKTRFTWHFDDWSNCSFVYEKGKAGFAYRIKKLPLFFRSYRIIPSFEEAKALLNPIKAQYFENPLKVPQIQRAPKICLAEDLYSLLKDKKILIYTGAGLSAPRVPLMQELEKSLHVDLEVCNGKKHFIKYAWQNPDKLCLAFQRFCEQAIHVEPTGAHWILKELSQKLNFAILTENVDLLHQKTGLQPLRSSSPQLSTEIEDFKQIDVIVCIGLYQDYRGLLSLFKKKNPFGVIVAIDLETPEYLSENDFICEGDAQEVLAVLYAQASK